jgi:hypothetical protein
LSNATQRTWTAMTDKHQVTTNLDGAVYEDLKSLAVERGISVAEMLRQLTNTGVAEEKTPDRPLSVKDGYGPPHLCFFAPTKHGKSTIIDEYVIPRLGLGRLTLVLTDRDKDLEIYREGFKVVPLASQRRFHSFDSESYQQLKALQYEQEFDELVQKAVDAVVSSKRRKVLVAVKIPDKKAKEWIVNDFITEVVSRDWQNLLFVVEDAFKYDCEELVGSGRKAGIVAVLATSRELPEDTALNTRLVLGPVGLKKASGIDPAIAAMAKHMGLGEFVWQYSAAKWARFRYERRKKRGSR